MGEPEYHLRCSETRDRMLAEAAEFVGEVAGKIRRCHDCFAELGRDLLQTRREIDRRADTSEIEPVATADIAVHYLADMQREPEAYRLVILADARKFGDAFSYFERARQHATAYCAGIAVAGDRKNRQQPVAHEL